MTADQASVVGLIVLGAITIALGLMAGLWIFGLRVLAYLSTARVKADSGSSIVNLLLWILSLFTRRFASFEIITALGHLRGAKSGYLKIMTVVVLLAMTMANCTLPTVLSVMGGFGNDLKEKILDATAHVLVDAERPDLTIPEAPEAADFDRLSQQLTLFSESKVVVSSARREPADAVTKALVDRGVSADRLEIRVRRHSRNKGVRLSPAGDDRVLADYPHVAEASTSVEGVIGVTPFIDADVMLASQTNIAAVVLKGVDTQTMDDVIGLHKTIEQGKLRYLQHPEEILPDVRAEQDRRLKLFLDEAALDDEDQQDAGSKARPRDGGTPRKVTPRRDPPPRRQRGKLGSHSESSERDMLPTIIVGRELAKTLRVFVGDEVNVVSPLGGMGPLGPIPKARPYRVGGVFFSGMYQDDAKNAYIRLDVAQRFLGMENSVSGVRIRVDEIEEADSVAAELRGQLGPRYRVRPWQEVNANLFSALRLEKIAMFALYSVFFIICAFLIASTLTMMVLEKRRGIAVLKTLGASNLRLGIVFMIQGVMAGLVGTISGQVAAYLQCLALGRFVEIEPEVYYISRLPVAIEPLEFAMVAGFAMLTAVCATALPLAATVMLRPVDGMRQ